MGLRASSISTTRFAGPAQTQDAMANPYYHTVQPGQTISIYDQVNATDARVEQMAPVINSSIRDGLRNGRRPPL